MATRKNNSNRKAKTVATENPVPTATVEAPIRVLPSLFDLLTMRVKGVGKATAEQVLQATSLKGSDQATAEQADRANAAPTQKAGLSGKAAALWVLTGASDGNGSVVEPEAPAVSTTRSLSEGIGQPMLDQYLTEHVSGDLDAPLKELPTIDEEGTLRVKAPHFQAWLVQQGQEVGRTAATKALRAAGLTAERWQTMPNGNRMMYVGPVPKPVTPRTEALPVREDVLLPESAVSNSRSVAAPAVAKPPADPFAALDPVDRKILRLGAANLKISAGRAWGKSEEAKAAEEARLALVKRLEA